MSKDSESRREKDRKLDDSIEQHRAMGGLLRSISIRLPKKSQSYDCYQRGSGKILCKLDYHDNGSLCVCLDKHCAGTGVLSVPLKSEKVRISPEATGSV